MPDWRRHPGWQLYWYDQAYWSEPPVTPTRLAERSGDGAWASERAEDKDGRTREVASWLCVGLTENRASKQKSGTSDARDSVLGR